MNVRVVSGGLKSAEAVKDAVARDFLDQPQAGILTDYTPHIFPITQVLGKGPSVFASLLQLTQEIQRTSHSRNAHSKSLI